MEVNVHYAKTHLSKLIAATENGEEVIISRAGKPAVKMVVVPAKARVLRKDLRGIAAGKFQLSDDAFPDGEDVEIQKMFDDELERSMAE
jgi:prevent-host-death family protein